VAINESLRNGAFVLALFRNFVQRVLTRATVLAYGPDQRRFELSLRAL
jgi:hypothetical protein